MDFRKYFFQLSPEKRETFARRCGTSVRYVQYHLLTEPPVKIPRGEFMQRLVKACDNEVSWDEVLEHFYRQYRGKR